MTTTQIEMPRKSSDFVSCAELRVLLKKNLGINSKQASVSKSSSTRYINITIRDASVSVEAVKKFAQTFNTWHMDVSDYVTGQSVHVETTKEVNAIHAAPFIEEIKSMIPKAIMDQGIGLSNGCVLWLDRQGYYIGKDQKRMYYISTIDTQKGEEYAIRALALQMATIGETL